MKSKNNVMCDVCKKCKDYTHFFESAVSADKKTGICIFCEFEVMANKQKHTHILNEIPYKSEVVPDLENNVTILKESQLCKDAEIVGLKFENKILREHIKDINYHYSSTLMRLYKAEDEIEALKSFTKSPD